MPIPSPSTTNPILQYERKVWIKGFATALVIDQNIANFGGTAVSLGQKAMAASIPVVIASDQSIKAFPNVVTGKSAANTALTITLPAVAGQFHYITYIFVSRSCTTAIAGTALLDYTSTNLNGIAWTVGNALAVGATQIDLNISLDFPLKSAVVNTASTIVIPAIGATGISRATVGYYTAA